MLFPIPGISVGFERSSYTFPEGTDLQEQVHIAKLNGQSTELDIVLQVTVLPSSGVGKSFISS